MKIMNVELPSSKTFATALQSSVKRREKRGG